MQDNESQLQSPFADRLHTNYIPLDPEIEQIHRVISKSLAEISRLDEKILHLQSMIDPLLRERKKISSYVDAHRALLSGMRRLPSELLQEIFIYCVSASRRYGGDVLIDCAEAPILLGHVCSSWRRTVMSTPHLWSFLDIYVFEDMFVKGCHDTFRLQQRVAALQHWLKLSGSCPLHISFYHPYADTEEVEQAMNLATISLFQALVPFSHRWEVIALRIPLSLFDPFFATFTEDVPLLKSISLTSICTTTERGRVTTWYPAPIFRVPTLRSLSLCNVNISTLVGNWNHLEHLDLRDIGREFLTTSKALETLSRCTNLISCRMAGVYGVNAAPASNISLPFLRSLDITEGPSRPSDLTGFFDALKVPSLRNFRYDEGSKLASEIGISCKSIMSQPHSPGIESIHLPPMLLSRIAEYLALLPFLKRLSIRRNTIDGEALEHRLDDCDLLTLLTPSSDLGTCLCPRLEEIKFKDCIAITEDALCAFLTARTSHPEVARLKKGRFSFLRPTTRDILPELESLNGLYLNITYY